MRDGAGLPAIRCAPLPGVELILADALRWMAGREASSVHAIVTDPPYGLLEYDDKDHDKLIQGNGGVWRMPPALNFWR